MTTEFIGLGNKKIGRRDFAAIAAEISCSSKDLGGYGLGHGRLQHRFVTQEIGERERLDQK